MNIFVSPVLVPPEWSVIRTRSDSRYSLVPGSGQVFTDSWREQPFARGTSYTVQKRGSGRSLAMYSKRTLARNKNPSGSCRGEDCVTPSVLTESN